MDSNPSASLEMQVHELQARMRRLEEALLRHGIALPAAPEERSVSWFDRPLSPLPAVLAVSSTKSELGTPQRETIEAQAERPLFAASAPSGSEDDRSLENRIGSQWFNRIGIVAMLIALAWFLKLAIDNRWIGASGRVLIGLVAGGASIAWSERFRLRGFAGFSFSLKALGSGCLYLSLWAAFALFHLIPPGVAFAAMIAVTAFNAFMSWVQDAELLALYAIAGGLSTPLLLSTGENREVALFSYLLSLDVAVLFLAALRPWSRLIFCAYAGSTLYFLGWWIGDYNPSEFARTAFLLGCFFLLFAFAPRLARLDLGDGAPASGWDALVLVCLPVANAALGFLVFYALVDSIGAAWAGPWLAVVFAAFYLLLLRLPAVGRLKESPAALSALHLAAAVVFLTIAIPLKAHGRWLTVGWLVEGAALLWVENRTRSQALRVLSLLSLSLGLVALLTVNPPASITPFLNQRFATYCVAISVFVFTVWMTGRARASADSETAFSPSALGPIAAIVVNALILLAVGFEIDNFWWALQWRGDLTQVGEYRMYAGFSYSAFFMIFGAVLLGAGFRRRSAFLRWQALILLAVTIGKVFMVDMHELSQGYRILSFLGLGALLLGVSFVYQRDWLHLRGEVPVEREDVADGRIL
jgi:uncharacterized membrane protein